MLLVPLICAALLGGSALFATAMLAVAAGTDFLDGWMARRFGWESQVGAVLDPLADKVLVISTAVTLAALGRLAEWLVGLIILRDLVILSGALVYRLRVGPFVAGALPVGKVTTLVVLLLLLTACLAPVMTGQAAAVWLLVLQWLAAVLLLASGGAYVTTWWQHYRRAREEG